MTKKLSPAIIKKRMQTLHNLQHLYAIARDRMDKLEEIIKLQDQQIERQEEADRLRDELIETQAVRIAELEAMIFGKKKKPPVGTPPKDQDKPTASSKPPRSKDSFKRTIPAAETVTKTIR